MDVDELIQSCGPCVNWVDVFGAILPKFTQTGVRKSVLQHTGPDENWFRLLALQHSGCVSAVHVSDLLIAAADSALRNSTHTLARSLPGKCNRNI